MLENVDFPLSVHVHQPRNTSSATVKNTATAIRGENLVEVRFFVDPALSAIAFL